MLTLNHIRKTLIALPLFALSLTACDKGKQVGLPMVTGANGEVLVVISDGVKADTSGRYIAAMLGDVYQGLNAAEPYFDMSTVPARYFDKNMKTFRNIIIVSVKDTLKTDTIHFYRDKWARPQCLITLNARDKAGLLSLVERNHLKIMSFLTKGERERMIAFNKRVPQLNLMEHISKRWGVSMLIPNTFTKCVPEDKDALSWIRMETDTYQASLMVYDFPYVGEGTLSKVYLLNKRDSLLRANIHSVPDKNGQEAYMCTEVRYGLDEIIYKLGAMDGIEVAELRGLWRMEGYPMGGPFILRAHRDTLRNRVVVTDGWAYYPSKDRKRNLIRQLEAIMYTLKIDKPQNLAEQQETKGL